MFEEPKSREDAIRRREELKRHKCVLQAEIAGLNASLKIRPHGPTAMARAKAAERLAAIDPELVHLKAWITERSIADNEERKKWNVVTDGVERARAVKAAMASLYEYIEFLERENAELKTELERLKGVEF